MVRRGGAGALALGVAIVSVQGCADRARIATQGRTRDTPSGAATLDLAAPVSASASARAAPPDGTDPRLEARLLELEARSDKRSTVRGKHDPNPAPTRPPRPLPAKGSFPSSSAIASIRAYAYNGAFPCSGAKDVTDEPFTRDGRLCDDVVPPVAELNVDERARIVALFDAANARQRTLERLGGARRARMRCGFDPHHVLVMFDAKGVPIAKLQVCFTCSEWQATPGDMALGGVDPAVMTPEERTAIGDVLDAHGLGAWMYGGAKLEEVAAYELRVYGAPKQRTAAGRARIERRRAIGSGVSPDLTASNLSSDDRERLCDWFRANMADAEDAGLSAHAAGNFECESGQPYSTRLDAGECEAKLTCNATVARIEACLRSFADGPERICLRGPAPECDTSWLPGVRWKPLR